MDNSIDYFFRWKYNLSKEDSVESINSKKNKYINEWEYKDVLYSFMGIYSIGLNLYYPNEFIKTEYTIRPKERPRMRQVSINYLVNDYSADKVKERYKKYTELNKLIESVGFIKYYDYPGNVIPIWPGASENRGKSYCFDIPDIYFKKNKKWVNNLIEYYPNANLDRIINSKYPNNTKDFLDYLNSTTRYKEFLKHVVDIIIERSKILNK